MRQGVDERSETCNEIVTNHKLMLRLAPHSLQFKFDAACGEASSQQDVFSFIQPAISQIVSGVNTTVFAYGQTGTGKTHTMLGEGLESQVSKKTSWTQMKNEIAKVRAGGARSDDCLPQTSFRLPSLVLYLTYFHLASLTAEPPGLGRHSSFPPPPL